MPAPKGNRNAAGRRNAAGNANPRLGKKGKACIMSMPHEDWEAFKASIQAAYGGFPQDDEFCVKEWRRLSNESVRQWCLWHSKEHWQYDTPQQAIDASVYGAVRTVSEDVVLRIESTSLSRGGKIVNVAPYTVSLRCKGKVVAQTIIDDLGELGKLEADEVDMGAMLSGKWEVTK
jgi:hypothetical protein